MVPIHYFLALFAILVSLMGCTQKVPPGSTQTIRSDNTTNLVDLVVVTEPSPEPTQSINHDDVNVVKPSNSEVTSIHLKVEKKDELFVSLVGGDAKLLYSLMEMDPKSKESKELLSTIKLGSHLLCGAGVNKKAISKITYTCSLVINTSDGEIMVISKKDDLKLDAKNAELVLNEKVNTAFLELDPITVGKFGRLVILGDHAKAIFNALKVDATNLKEIGTTHDRSGKKGKTVACYQETFGIDVTPSFKCQFFFNYDSGKFDEIQDLL